MYTIEPFNRTHYYALAEHAPEGMPVFGAAMLSSIESANSWTVLSNGTPIMCCGALQLWTGRFHVWTFMGEQSGKHMVRITREVRRLLRTIIGRMEMTVNMDFAAGHRWAKLLGFEIEIPLLKQYGPAGESHIGYVRFN